MPDKKSTSKKTKQEPESADFILYNPRGIKHFTNVDQTGPMNEHNDWNYVIPGSGSYGEKMDRDIQPGPNGVSTFTPRNHRIVDPTTTTPFDKLDQQKELFFNGDDTIISNDNLNPGTDPSINEPMYSDWKGQGLTSTPPFPGGGAIIPQNKHIDQKNPTHFFQSGTNGNPATGVVDTKDGFILYDGGLAQAKNKTMYSPQLFETDGFVCSAAQGKSINNKVTSPVTPDVKGKELQSTKMGSSNGSGRNSTKGTRGARTTRAFAHGFSLNVKAATLIKNPTSPNASQPKDMANRNGDQLVSDTRNKPTVAVDPTIVQVTPNLAVSQTLVKPLSSAVPEKDIERSMDYHNPHPDQIKYPVERAQSHLTGPEDPGRAQDEDKDKSLF